MPKELSRVHAYRDQTCLMSVVDRLFPWLPRIAQDLVGLVAELADELINK